MTAAGRYRFDMHCSLLKDGPLVLTFQYFFGGIRFAGVDVVGYLPGLQLNVFGTLYVTLFGVFIYTSRIVTQQSHRAQCLWNNCL